MTALLAEFTPESRPAFWRAIVTQVLLYGCYLHLVLRGPVTRGGNLPDLAAALIPQLEHAVDAGLRLDKFWMSDEQPIETEVNRKAIRDALPCAALYYRLRVLSALDLGTLELHHLGHSAGAKDADRQIPSQSDGLSIT